MAERRMFSKSIINSARFLKMPSETQALYFHLGLHADDDGVVEAYNVLRFLGASEDSLKILVAKGFVQVLNEDLVSYILDWNEHNKIRADRKIDSIYKNLLIQVNPDAHLIEPKIRADVAKIHQIGQPMDVQWTADGRHRLGKDRLGEDSIVEYNMSPKGSRFQKPSIEEIKKEILAKNYNVDAETFYHFYESNGWHVGNKKMKSWQSALVTWHRKSNTYGGKNSSLLHRQTRESERDYSGTEF